MESIAVWQGATLGGIVAWILISSYLNVIAGTPLIFQIQVLFNFCNYKRKPRSSFLFNCLYIYVFLLFIGVNFFFFLGFFFFRNTSIGFLMLCSLGCPVLFLCPFTLPLSLCYSGYVLSLYNVDNGL